MIPAFRLHDVGAPLQVDGEPFRPQLPARPRHVVLILLPVVRAGAVHQHPAGFQGGPCLPQDVALPRRAHVHIPGRPLVHRLHVLAEHALARARRIHHQHVKPSRQRGEIRRRVMGDKRVRITPLRHVFRQDARPRTDDLVAHQQRSIRQALRQQRGLAPRGGTQVKHPRGLRKVLPHGLCQEHGTGLLHIIRPSMQQRVEREHRALRQVIPRTAPRHTVGRRGERHLVVHPHAYRRGFAQRPLKRRIIRPKQRLHGVCEWNGKLHETVIEPSVTYRPDL